MDRRNGKTAAIISQKLLQKAKAVNLSKISPVFSGKVDDFEAWPLQITKTEYEQEKILEKSPKNHKSQEIPDFEAADSCETVLQLRSFMLNHTLESTEIEFQDIEGEYGKTENIVQL